MMRELLDGPWKTEGDRHEWRDERTGLPALILRGPHGALCGYVGVAPGHPWHGLEYSGCALKPTCGDVVDCDHSPSACVDVHGGLTYSDACQEDGKICHVPLPGEPETVWWFGFDCGHGGDLCPAVVTLLPEFRACETYRDLAYVREQVTGLAQQIASAA